MVACKLRWTSIFTVAVLGAGIWVGCKGKGPAGAPGASCWDLNGNGACDPATEDYNNDGQCTVADCVGTNPSVSGALQGTVTNTAGTPLEGVTVTLDPSVSGVDMTTDASGAFSANVPIGAYSMTFEADGYDSTTMMVGVTASNSSSMSVQLSPTAPVTVDAGNDVTASPGDSVSLTATVTVRDGSTIQGYQWDQLSGPTLAVTGDTSDTLGVTLGSLTDYRDAILAGLQVQDRFQVVAINPMAFDDAKTSTFQVTVTTSSGTYTATVSVDADIPYEVNTGLQNVAVGQTLLLHGADQGSYDWSLTRAPAGATAALDDPASQTPTITVDKAGEYDLTEATSGTTMVIKAGNWVGAISGIDADGLPEADLCQTCHNGLVAPDKFTPWKQSGHAEIFTQNLNAGGHYGEACFGCHTVGYDTALSNNGFDDQSDYQDFLGAGLLGTTSPDNWATVVSSFPNTAKLANIQCENCHGPNDLANSDHMLSSNTDPTNPLHGLRTSLSSDVCGSCHGEPLRHARFQQWQRSGHANFQLAEEEGTVEGRGATAAHCGRCHTAQGFLTWISQGDLTKRIQGANGDATVAELTALGMTDAQVQPQTCVTCHDPHAEGSTTGKPNNATVRISGSTPMLPAGFAAVGVGRGAICMTCHNTRNGAHNDNVPMTSLSGPHVPSQTDILMGQNAYFVSVGVRGDHSLLPDTCATCHMEETNPPADLSYQLGGTNHQFNADISICGNCHGDFNGQGLVNAFDAEIQQLQSYMGDSVLASLNALGAIQVKAYDETTGLYSSSSNVAVDLSTNPLTNVDIADVHGQIAFTLTLTTPIQMTWSDTSTTTTDTFDVQIGNLLDGGGNAVYPAGSNMAKAGWNLLLIENDGSHGVHNPDFVSRILNATLSTDLSP